MILKRKQGYRTKIIIGMHWTPVISNLQGKLVCYSDQPQQSDGYGRGRPRFVCASSLLLNHSRVSLAVFQLNNRESEWFVLLSTLLICMFGNCSPCGKFLFENTESNQKFLKHLLKHSPVCMNLICPNTLRFQFGNCLGSVIRAKQK